MALSDIEALIRSNTVHRAVPPDLRIKQGRAWIDETSTRVTETIKGSGTLRPLSYYLGVNTEAGAEPAGMGAEAETK